MKSEVIPQLGLGLLIAVGLNFAATQAFADAKDACSLITSADAQSAIGEPVGPPQNQNRSFGAGDAASCKYRSTVGKAFSAKSVSLTIHSNGADVSGSAGSIADNLKSAGFENVQQVPGVGSAAVWGTNSAMGRAQGELTVLKGKSIMLVILITGIPDQAQALAKAKAIAASALSKL